MSRAIPALTAALRLRFRRWREWAGRHPRAAVLLAVLLGVPATGLTSIAGEALVRARLDAPGAHTPTRFYARPLVIQAGRTLDRAELEQTLERLGYRRARRGSVRAGEYAASASGWEIGRRAFRVGDWLD
ncbi:MAG: hypothetical protein IH616_13155, partial [Gemmatimonadales bacterium]|nr:hypothetical protein [Gemmatimonadales bacterium]